MVSLSPLEETRVPVSTHRTRLFVPGAFTGVQDAGHTRLSVVVSSIMSAATLLGKEFMRLDDLRKGSLRTVVCLGPATSLSPLLSSRLLGFVPHTRGVANHRLDFDLCRGGNHGGSQNQRTPSNRHEFLIKKI